MCVCVRQQGSRCRIFQFNKWKVKVPKRLVRGQMTLSKLRFCLFIFVVFHCFCLLAPLYLPHGCSSEAPRGGETLSAVSLSWLLIVNPGRKERESLRSLSQGITASNWPWLAHKPFAEPSIPVGKGIWWSDHLLNSRDPSWVLGWNVWQRGALECIRLRSEE